MRKYRIKIITRADGIVFYEVQTKKRLFEAWRTYIDKEGWVCSYARLTSKEEAEEAIKKCKKIEIEAEKTREVKCKIIYVN